MRSREEKLVRRVISPAIEGQSCPICLGALEPRRAAVLTSCHHAYCAACIREWSGLRRKCPLCNADFGSWFSEIDLRSGSFQKELLPPTNPASRSFFSRDDQLLLPPTFLRNRSRPLPRRRSFGRPGSAGSDVIAERKLQWRARCFAESSFNMETYDAVVEYKRLQ